MKINKRIACLSALLCAFMFAAPAPQKAQAGSFGDVAKAVTNYVPNLVMDTMDIFRVNVSTGKGVGMDLSATHLADVGYDDYDVKRFGFNGRSDAGLALTADDAKDHKGATLAGVSMGDRESDPYEVGAKVHALGGVEFSVNLRKALDAVTGLVFIDLEGDNADYAGDLWG